MKKISILTALVSLCIIATNVNYLSTANVRYVAYSAPKVNRIAQAGRCGEPGEDAVPDPDPICIPPPPPSTNCLFDEATCTWIEYSCDDTPIIIDLNNDGYNLTDTANGAQFDLGCVGRLHQWSWTAQGSDEAFLALDRNGDGKITSGRELFGNHTNQPTTEEPNGFIALKVFDDNGDNRIDASDSIYQILKLWVDANHDGVSQAAEMSGLAAKGVESISTEYRLSRRTDRHGNRFKYKARAIISGQERLVWDVLLVPGK